MTFRNIFTIILIILLFGCVPRQKERGHDIVVATLKGPSAVGMIKMMDELNRYDSSGISFNILSEPVQVRKMMLEGEADFAILPMNMAAVMYNKGLPYSLVAVPISGSLYLAGSNKQVKGWADLRSLKVHVMAKGMTPDALFRYLLLRNSLTPDQDVYLDYNFPSHTELASAIAAGRAALGIITEPYLSLIMESNSEIEPLIDLSREWEKIEGYPIAETAFLVRSELLSAKKDMVEEILSRYAQSTKWVNEHPDSAAALVVKYNIIPDAQAAQMSIPRSNLHFRRAKEHKIEIEAYLRTIYEMNPELIGGKMPDEEFYQ